MRRPSSIALVVAALATVGAPARAHTVPGSITLSERVLLSDVVLVATITDPSLPDAAPEKKPGHLLAQATVVDVVRGASPGNVVRFEPHSHSGDSYAPGETLVLFLQRSDPPGGPYHTVDDVSDRVSLGTPTAARPSRAEVTTAVRAYAQALAARDDAARASQRKEATLALLRSKDSKLQTSALRDMAQGAIAIGEQDAPALLAVADDPRMTMPIRVMVLEELSRRSLVDPTPRYVRWLEAAAVREIEPLARAAGMKRGAEITAALAAKLADPDDAVAASAARALGEPFHESAIPALSAAATSGRKKLAAGAVDGLGQMGTPAAKQALEALLSDSGDAAQQRLIQTQLNRLAQRAPALAPAPSAATSVSTEAAPPRSSAPPSPVSSPLWKIGAAIAAAAGAWFAATRRARARRGPEG